MSIKNILVTSLLITLLGTGASWYVLKQMERGDIQKEMIGTATEWKQIIDVYTTQVGAEGADLEPLKDLIAAQKIGETGYIWVRTADGVYVVSKDRARDGENINSDSVEAHTQVAKAAPDGGNFVEYPWQNPGESRPRMKIAGLAYNESLDWVIGASAYYDDPAFREMNIWYVAVCLFLISFASIFAISRRRVT